MHEVLLWAQAHTQFRFGELQASITFSPRKVIFLLSEFGEHQSSLQILASSQTGWYLAGKKTSEEGQEPKNFCEFHQLEVWLGHLLFHCEYTFYDKVSLT